jgi:hypothetical protein
MRLAKDTCKTLDLAVEALIELLGAIGPYSKAEPSLGQRLTSIRSMPGIGTPAIWTIGSMNTTAVSHQRMSCISTQRTTRPTSMPLMRRQGGPCMHC